jgi:hypothetical protein
MKWPEAATDLLRRVERNSYHRVTILRAVICTGSSPDCGNHHEAGACRLRRRDGISFRDKDRAKALGLAFEKARLMLISMEYGV